MRPPPQAHWSAREHSPEDQCHSVNAFALRDHSAPICIFLCFTRRPAASLGGVPHGVQDRVRERQEGFFAANQCRRVCNDWPLVAASLLVLSLIGLGTRCRNGLTRQEATQNSRRRSNHTAQRLCCRSQFLGGKGVTSRRRVFGCLIPRWS